MQDDGPELMSVDGDGAFDGEPLDVRDTSPGRAEVRVGGRPVEDPLRDR